VDGHRAILVGRQLLTGRSYFLGDTAFFTAFWRVAALTAGVFGATPSAGAATYFWPDYYEPAPSYRAAPPRIYKAKKHRLPRTDAVAKDARKPQGPLIIAISIEKQVLKVYDANGYFAETPISTGMRGHSTPMGVFSVIQKHKYHQSNIYSGAPMPYMQRITWSGVAMHAGVLPGYPASHGCIRMPMNFAVKMWGWTRMGARVVITPGEMTPESFSHPLLATQKTAPIASLELLKNIEVAVTTKSDKAAIAGPAVAPAYSEASLELKSTVGHDLAKPAPSTHTADASSATSQPQSPLTIIDAPVVRSPALKIDDDASRARDKAGDAAVEAESPVAGARPAETDASASIEKSASADGQKAAENAAPDAAKIETAEIADVKADALKSDAVKAIDKPGDPVVPDANKDQAPPSDPDKAAASKSEPAIAAAPKRSGQIAVFVSRKDGKLYVRQNFAPLFDVPVTIAPDDRPLGTHVFTAQTDKDDANLLHWSAISMPVAARNAARQDEDERAVRRRKTTGAIEVKPVPVPDSATEALDRLTIPADAMARIAESLSTGGSIIVSDQGINAGETGEGTDFIIPLR
jgi:lipoprotein-anchoring transpeptidase ErfK/SrfK